MTLDRIDQSILEHLQTHGRLTNVELADRVGLSPSPCLRRVRHLEETGLIKGYQAVVDQAKAGLPVSVFVSVRLEQQREEAMARFEAAVRGFPEVLECYLMTGTRDYLLRVVASDLAGYEQFIEGVASIESSFALAQVKHTTALPVAPKG
jgi:Lrp/AsnC family transcriptional regulator, leucine-responsive regulatory protein